MDLIVSYHRIEDDRILPIGAELIYEHDLDRYKSDATGRLADFSAGLDEAQKPRGFVVVDELERQIFSFILENPATPMTFDRDRTTRHLRERAALTRKVCEELRGGSDPDDQGPRGALFDLLRWISDNRTTPSALTPSAAEDLDRMDPPDGCTELVAEIRAGADVCDAVFMVSTADTLFQASQNRAELAAHLAVFWERYPDTTRAR